MIWRSPIRWRPDAMNVQAKDGGTLEAEMRAMGHAARDAAAALREASTTQKNTALLAAAAAIRATQLQILAANEDDKRAAAPTILYTQIKDRLQCEATSVEA